MEQIFIMLFCPVDWMCILPLEKDIMSYISEWWQHRGQGFLCNIGTYLANHTRYIPEESKFQTFLFYEGSCLLKCDALSLGERLLRFWWIIVPSSEIRLSMWNGQFCSWRWRCPIPSERWPLLSMWHTVESQKTWILGEVAVITSHPQFYCVCVCGLGNVRYTLMWLWQSFWVLVQGHYDSLLFLT